MLNTAQKFLQSFFANSGGVYRTYKAPHARLGGTPERRHYPRASRAGKEYRPGKLFKGHRI